MFYEKQQLPESKKASKAGFGAVRDKGNKMSDKYFQKYDQAETLKGRVILNLWRLIAHEFTFKNFELGNVSFEILKQRMPEYGWR